MNKLIALFKKIVNFFKKANYNTGFAQVNQPCFTKDGKFIGWFSRSMATALYLFCNDKNGVLHVLASERGKGAADFNGYWNCTCGYLDFNETTKQCALRELKEETGVEVDERNLMFIGYEDSPSANKQNVTFRFTSFIGNDTIENIGFNKSGNEKNEVGEIKWIPFSEVDNYKWAFGHDKRIKEAANFLAMKDIIDLGQ